MSYFALPKSGTRVGEAINTWSARFTPETIKAQLLHATATRRRILALEFWLPPTFAVAGLICCAAGFLGRSGDRR